MAYEQSWYEVDLEALIEFMQIVSLSGGIASQMFGGYGHYYKVVWSLEGQNGFVTSQTSTGISEKLRLVVEAGRHLQAQALAHALAAKCAELSRR